MRLNWVSKVRLSLIGVSLLAMTAACSSQVHSSTLMPVSTTASVTPAPPTTLRHLPFLYVEAENEDYYLARLHADGTATRLVQLPDFLRATADGPSLDIAPKRQQIVFSTLSDSIYTVQADGSGLTRLLGDGWHGHVPLWSPNEAWLAFVGGPAEQDSTLYVMHADGSELHRVTPEEMGVEFVFNQPLWLDDSVRLLFVGGLPTGEDSHANLYTVQIDGADLTCLTCQDPVPAPPCCAFPFQLALSPTASQVAYVWLDWNVYLLEVNTGQRRALTTPPIRGSGLHWSPDGQSLAFRGETEAGLATFVVKPDGPGLLQPLMRGDLNVSSWSPDGQKLALTQVETASTPSTLSYKFYIVAVDGHPSVPFFFESMPITGTEGEVWTPDSQQLLYAISVDEQQANFDFYLVNADGRGVIGLTRTPGYKKFVAWLPQEVR